MDKLAQLSDYIDRNLQSPNITPTQRFILARDQAYFKAVFFSGDRPGDIGLVKVPEILRFLACVASVSSRGSSRKLGQEQKKSMRFPNDDGFLFNHAWGKTLRDGDDNVFGIKRNPQRSVLFRE